MSPTQNFERVLSRDALSSLDARVLHDARNATKAVVREIEWPLGVRAVVKDMAPRPLWYRLIAGRFFLAREWRALEFLDEMESVPRGLARPDADCIVMEFCEGEPFLRFESGQLPRQAVEDLEKIVYELHTRGVTHGDLHRDNILLASNGQVWLIDWATACVFGPKRGFFKNRMWHEWQALDLRALAKIKARYAPDLLRPNERRILEHGGSTFSRLVRIFGAFFRRFRVKRKKK